MRNSVSDVTDAEILDEAREAMTQAAFDAADEANAMDFRGGRRGRPRRDRRVRD